MLGFWRKRRTSLPTEPLDRLITLGRFHLDTHTSGITIDVWTECVVPFRPAADDDPEGLLADLRALVARDPGGFATYGASRLAGELLGFECRSANALALLDEAIAFKRARGLPSAALTGYEWKRWCELHRPEEW